MSFKTTRGLMRHLRKRNIPIQGSRQKCQLMNMGYFHGYKGYRFFGSTSRKIPFQNFDEVYQTVQYDSALKELLYGRIMLIETAIKNRAMERIMIHAGSERIDDILDRVISSYNNTSSSLPENIRQKVQQNKFELQKTIDQIILEGYRRKNPQITHFIHLNTQHGIPIWALFEIMTLGNFGKMLSCLTQNVREDISKHLDMRTSMDTNREFVHRFIWLLKDLRNAVAHNLVVFDTRFSHTDVTNTMKTYLARESGLPHVRFDNIGDYIVLIAFFLNRLGVTKTENKRFLRSYVRLSSEYEAKVSSAVAHMVLPHGLRQRMRIMENHL